MLIFCRTPFPRYLIRFILGSCKVAVVVAAMMMMMMMMMMMITYPMGSRGSFPGVKRSDREADHSHLVPMSRMSGAIPPLPNTPSWRGVQLKHRDNFTFYLIAIARS
jgi:hypothetical protein